MIDYHSLLRCDEKTIAEMRGEPPMGYEAGVMMDYVFTVREGAAGGSPEIAVTRCGEASPGAPLTPSAFIEEHADQPNSEDAPGAPGASTRPFLQTTTPSRCRPSRPHPAGLRSESRQTTAVTTFVCCCRATAGATTWPTRCLP